MTDIEYRSQETQDFEENVWFQNEQGATTADILVNINFAASGKEARIVRFNNCCQVCGATWKSWRQDFLCSKRCREHYHKP